MPYELDFLVSYDRDSIAAELQRIAGLLGQTSLTSKDIYKHGLISPTAVARKFGSIREGLIAAGLTPARRWTDEELLKMLADLWAKTLADCRRSPRTTDLQPYGIPASWRTYTKRFGTWTNALLAASRMTDSGEIPAAGFPPGRTAISQRLRFLVFQRDAYTCRICKESGVKLEADHIVPHSRGGSNDIDNLQTLCGPCNRGKGGNVQ